MAPRRRLGRRRLRLWCGCLGLWCGCLGLWCGCLGLWWGCHRLSWGGQRLLCLRWRCRDRRRDRLYRRRRDLRRIRRDLPRGGRPDQCGEHSAGLARFQLALPVMFHRESPTGRRFLPRRRCCDHGQCRWLRPQIVCAVGSVLHARSDLVHRLARRGMSPLRSEPRSHRHHARGGAYHGGDHRALGMYSPPTHSHRLRLRYAVMFRCGRTPTWPSHRAPNLRVCAKAQW